MNIFSSKIGDFELTLYDSKIFSIFAILFSTLFSEINKSESNFLDKQTYKGIISKKEQNRNSNYLISLLYEYKFCCHNKFNLFFELIIFFPKFVSLKIKNRI